MQRLAREQKSLSLRGNNYTARVRIKYFPRASLSLSVHARARPSSRCILHAGDLISEWLSTRSPPRAYCNCARLFSFFLPSFSLGEASSLCSLRSYARPQGGGYPAPELAFGTLYRIARELNWFIGRCVSRAAERASLWPTIPPVLHGLLYETCRGFLTIDVSQEIGAKIESALKSFSSLIHIKNISTI